MADTESIPFNTSPRALKESFLAGACPCKRGVCRCKPTCKRCGLGVYFAAHMAPAFIDSDEPYHHRLEPKL